ncbi:MAG TPA: hypothetical protein VH593_04575, partial [Ktedonobacteraceae bacterium]
MKLVLLLIGAIPVIVLIMFVSEFTKKHGMALIFIRWAIGHHLDGKKRTNARAFKRGKKSPNTEQYSKWSHRSHAERSAIRWGTLAVLLLSGYGLLKDFHLVWMILAGLGA